MVDGSRVADTVFRGTHGLIHRSLQPKDSGIKRTCHRPLVELKADEVRPANGGYIMAEHPLDALSRSALISEHMQRCAHHPLADQRFARIRRICRYRATSSDNRHR